jgi:FKBP-type peptidyl-prolyl cis-trans isomerase FklB
MKYKIWLIMAVVITAVFSGCKGNDGSSKGENFGRDASYAFGMSIGMDVGSMLESSGITLNLDEFLKGMKDILTDSRTRLTESEAEAKIQEAIFALYGDLQDQQMEELRQEGIGFLIENSKDPDVIITQSGLQYKIISETSGPKPSADDVVQVNYEGFFINGEIFDSSYVRGSPVEFQVNGVIPGWTEGLQLMSVGSQYVFFIPAELGYGTYGAGSIPPYATLIFVVELLDILQGGE